MSIALVSAGPVASATYTTTLAPAFGQATTAGNFLAAWMFGNSQSASAPYSALSAPGWTVVAPQWGGAFQWGAFAYKAGCGAGETAPTFTSAGAPGFTYSMLAEFSGVAASSPLDQAASGGNSGGATQTATAGAPDAAHEDLIIGGAGWNGSTASLTIASTMHDSDGASVSVTAYNNSGTGTGPYYNFMWGIAGATLGGSGDTATSTLSAFESGGCGIASFLAASGGSNVTAQLAASLAAAALAVSGSERIGGALAASLAPMATAAGGLVKQNVSAELAASLAPLALRAGRRRRGGGMLLFTGGL